jgi:hypothetical protein
MNGAHHFPKGGRGRRWARIATRDQNARTSGVHRTEKIASCDVRAMWQLRNMHRQKGNDARKAERPRFPDPGAARASVLGVRFATASDVTNLAVELPLAGCVLFSSPETICSQRDLSE